MSINTLQATRVYLSGPMDFVGSRTIEKYLGWRAVMTPILKALNIRVLDPWNKPNIRGHKDYGQEGLVNDREAYSTDFWTNNATRARFEKDFWETVHIDLRMVDIADFVIAFCPTNIYSVGTVHEIIVSRMQHKPVLLVSPPVTYDLFPELEQLNEVGREALRHYGLKENPHGIPSQWMGNIVGGHNLFNGFGWENIDMKRDDFYPTLIQTVLKQAEPQDSASESHQHWQQVKTWVENYTPLWELKGGVLDTPLVKHAPEDEKALLMKELEQPREQERHYFWYNKAYQPERTVLFQMFRIASGHIPPRVRIVPEKDGDNAFHYRSVESMDDNWLLIEDD